MTDEWVQQALADGTALTSLELQFQPVVSLTTGAVEGAESFIKWRGPDGQVLPTAAWLPHAHATGTMTDCSSSMLSTWAASSAGAGGPIISFNLAGDQLVDEGFMEELFAIPPGVATGLAIEIHQLQWDVEHANTVQPQWSWIDVPDFDRHLDDLGRHGFSIWVDDFGDGSDDAEVINDVNVDIVKLDGRFAGASPEVVEPIVSVIHSASKLALLERIETEQHEQLAIEAGVDLGQGFLFAPTLTRSAFESYRTG